MRMSESTGMKMGPRETMERERGHSFCGLKEGRPRCRAIERAMLADALEEALAFWDDAGISEANTEHHDRLRAVLAEVGRG